MNKREFSYISKKTLFIAVVFFIVISLAYNFLSKPEKRV